MDDASNGDDTRRETSDRGPYTLPSGSDRRHVFWADRIADLIESRSPTEPIIIKGGISPSGVPHLGNVNELMRGYFVAEVLRERGWSVDQVFTTDDRDPLRGMPRTLADLEGNLVGLGEVDAGALGRNLGKPYTAIPDPFGCCESYGDHFSKLIQRSAELLGVPIRIVSTTDLYESGRFEEITEFLLENRDRARTILAEYQRKVDEDYVPFNPICENCGKVTETVIDVDLESGTVTYRCTDLIAGDRRIEGCDHEGTTSFRSGKLPWRFEWPAQWKLLDVDFEPFGKDHAEGSWPSGEHIAREIFDREPPVPMVYEWFTLNGEPLSSSSGNVILVEEILQLIEVEVLRYFFAKDPKKARDFDIVGIDRLVDEFDRFERLFFGEEQTDDEKSVAFSNRVYPFVVDEVDPDRVRIPYTFAAILGMTDDPRLRADIARREGHIPATADPSTVDEALDRVERARNWARRVDNEYNYDLKRDELPTFEIDADTGAALDELADFIERTEDPDAIQGEIYEIARRHGLEVGDFFAIGYRLFFDQEQGPRLGRFLAQLDRDFVVDRLRRER